MAFEGTLTVEGTDYPINWLLLRVIRREDQRGKPASRPDWGVVLSLPALDDSTIKYWMLDPHMQKDGRITLNRIDQDATYKEIEFKKACCVWYQDNFFADVDYLTTVINIIGGEVTFNKATLTV